MPKSVLHDEALQDQAASCHLFDDAQVYVIDDDSEMRKSLHFLLSTIGVVSWPFESATDFLADLNFLKPAPILLDIRMPVMDGLQLMNELSNRDIGWPVIVMTAHGQIPIAVQAIKLGAIEFLEKPFSFEALDISLQSAFVQLAGINNKVTARDDARRRFDLLSPRETDVLKILMQGVPNKTAAHLLSLSVRTIEMHRGNALSKLDVKSLAEVVRLAAVAELELPSSAKVQTDAKHQ